MSKEKWCDACKSNFNTLELHKVKSSLGSDPFNSEEVEIDVCDICYKTSRAWARISSPASDLTKAYVCRHINQVAHYLIDHFELKRKDH